MAMIANSHTRQAATSVRANPSKVLVRRLAIRCPVTGLPADTGFDISAVPEIVTAERLLVDCQECGQDHIWLPHEAFLD
jgi:hypothetical protein